MSESRDLAAVVMAGGLGTRMRSSLAKHLHPLLGRRVVDWVLDAARGAGADPVVVVASPDTADRYEGMTVAVQNEPLGTGDAVASARLALQGFEGDVLVLDAAAPLLAAHYLDRLVGEHRGLGAAVTILSFESTRPLPYGRVVRGADGDVQSIVEEKDATAEQRAIRELNSSIYVFRPEALWDALGKLDARNAQGELYLTDTIEHIVAAGGRAGAWLCPDEEATLGINTRAELAIAAAVLRDRINEAHMLAGVTIVDPATTWIEPDVEIEADATIQPFSVIRGPSRIEAGAEIGPFAYIRPGTTVGSSAKVGTFVEVKASTIGARSKVPHSSYIGDAEIGEDTNIAAGNITANFKHAGGPKARTRIGNNVRTGVDNVFNAPVEVGDDAWIAPGTVITDDVPEGSLAGFPPRQVTKEGWVYEKRGRRDDDN
ncbi:MAG TPA: NTP transferase domain-containing protein [Gaiellaceae bacterium]|nr:NTP transferase domain-containing protein [Gaiellaceae bacterium]